jgi:hypothetical protein
MKHIIQSFPPTRFMVELLSVLFFKNSKQRGAADNKRGGIGLCNRLTESRSPQWRCKRFELHQMDTSNFFNHFPRVADIVTVVRDARVIRIADFALTTVKSVNFPAAIIAIDNSRLIENYLGNQYVNFSACWKSLNFVFVHKPILT